MEREMTMHIPD